MKYYKVDLNHTGIAFHQPLRQFGEEGIGSYGPCSKQNTIWYDHPTLGTILVEGQFMTDTTGVAITVYTDPRILASFQDKAGVWVCSRVWEELVNEELPQDVS